MDQLQAIFLVIMCPANMPILPLLSFIILEIHPGPAVMPSLIHGVVSASWTWVCVCLHSRLFVAASINLVFLWTSTCSYLLYLMVSAFICLTAALSPPLSNWQFLFSPGLLSLSQNAPATRVSFHYFSFWGSLFQLFLVCEKFLGNIPSKLLVHKTNYLYNIITIINTNNLK